MPERSCLSCDTPVPVGAMFCPKCGEATPTGLNRRTGEVEHPPHNDGDESEYRERLQRAIGEGYRLGELIGRGGFGVVYSAWETALHREVAVKALRHDLFPNASLIERFKREARAAAKLRHPNIIPIYAVGEGEGIAYMIMPNIFGEPLSATLKREGRLSIQEATKILVEAARALGVAHRAGIVHRDVKPENIFLEGDERRVYLMDFGIAKALGAEEEGLTGTGMIIGTPTFMSPEQAGGQPDIDHRADMYSLGVLGYQMIAGRLPYEAESLQDLIYKQVTSTPPLLNTLRPETPPALVQAVHRCLAKDADERWDTAEAFADAVTSGAPVRTWRRRRRTPWVVIAALVVLGGAGVALGTGVFAGNGDPVASATTQTPEEAVADDESAQSASEAVGPGSDVAATLARETAAAGGAAVGESEPSPVQNPPAQTSPPAQPVAPPPAPPARATAPQVGFLTVDARPWGMVQIDGVNVRESPLFQHQLTPGTYVISVVRDGYRTWADTVEITTGNTTRRTPALVRDQQ